MYKFTNQWMNLPVYLQTQFDRETDLSYLECLTWFANPVSKNREPMYDKNAHLASYRLFQPAPEDMRTVDLDNQFGKQKIITGEVLYLLAPARKIERGSKLSKKLNHYKVYKVLDGKSVKTDVKLEDQFGKNKVTVSSPYAFAAPAEKRHDGQVFPVNNKKAHLVLYKITPNRIEKTKTTKDQFGKHQLNFQYSFLLAVPSIKLEWNVI